MPHSFGYAILLVPALLLGTEENATEEESTRKRCRYIITSLLLLVACGYTFHPSLAGVSVLQSLLLVATSSWLWVVPMPYVGFVPYPLLVTLCTLALPYGSESFAEALALGDFVPSMVRFSLLIIVLTVAALVLWSDSVNGDHGHIQQLLGPVMNEKTIPLFALVNALFEEMEFRVVVMNALLPYHALDSISLPILLALVLVQAVLFAMQHVAGGFPCGRVGFALVLLWGFVLGLIRCWDRGVGLVYVIHVVADLTIGVLLFRQQRECGESKKD
mmetsp:Transcript_13005/g.14881  ORF Transcript_13005/g.14881 Transcript_13005/m.14881 type:complete len:274 (-) Transcript_13005:192-1013(-)